MTDAPHCPPLLSVCIASYNRGRELAEKVTALLAASPDIEVVVSDNASTDDTDALLSAIASDRFRYSRNPENLGPTANYVKALAAARGKYAMFMCDKDFVNLRHQDFILSTLRSETFSMGYFVLDSTAADPAIRRFKAPSACLDAFAYLSKHPTGYFFNTPMMMRLDLARCADVSAVGVFPFEFIATELALKGNCAILDLPFVTTGSIYKQGGGISSSNTYSSANKNLFFAPACRFEQYERYVRHLKSLKMNGLSRLRCFAKLTRRTLVQATAEFKALAANKDLMAYYKVSPQDCETGKIEATLTALLENSDAVTGFYRWLFRRELKKRMKKERRRGR